MKHSTAINAVLTAIILPICQWAAQWTGAFFFIVIGDDHCTDVAWANTEGLSQDGAFALTVDPEIAGAFEDMKTSFDILLEDNLENPEYRKAFENTCPSVDKCGWHSLDKDEEMKSSRSLPQKIVVDEDLEQ
jgi:hypothetical protein